jgi:hypothetical protein
MNFVLPEVDLHLNEIHLKEKTGVWTSGGILLRFWPFRTNMLGHKQSFFKVLTFPAGESVQMPLLFSLCHSLPLSSVLS